MAMKKQVDLLEKKLEELEKTIGYQQDMINAMNNTLTNQRFLFEMLMTKINQPAPVAEMPTSTLPLNNATHTPHPTPVSTPKGAPNPFPLIRRTMV